MNTRAARDVRKDDAVGTVIAATFDDDPALCDVGDMGAAHSDFARLLDGDDRGADTRTIRFVAHLLNAGRKLVCRRGRYGDTDGAKRDESSDAGLGENTVHEGLLLEVLAESLRQSRLLRD